MLCNRTFLFLLFYLKEQPIPYTLTGKNTCVCVCDAALEARVIIILSFLSSTTTRMSLNNLCFQMSILSFFLKYAFFWHGTKINTIT